MDGQKDLEDIRKYRDREAARFDEEVPKSGE